MVFLEMVIEFLEIGTSIPAHRAFDGHETSRPCTWIDLIWQSFVLYVAMHGFEEFGNLVGQFF